jgi:hypothetical protein
VNNIEEAIINPETNPTILLIKKDIKKIFKYYKLKTLLIGTMIWANLLSKIQILKVLA